MKTSEGDLQFAHLKFGIKAKHMTLAYVMPGKFAHLKFGIKAKHKAGL